MDNRKAEGGVPTRHETGRRTTGKPEGSKARGGIAVGAPHGRTDTAGMLDAEIKNMLQP